MSHFYATIPTSTRKTTLTAQGTADTGVTTYTASWKGAIKTHFMNTRVLTGLKSLCSPGETLMMMSLNLLETLSYWLVVTLAT